MLHLNDTQIKGSNIKVASTLSLAGEDLGGQSSSAALAEKGNKPKQLGIQLQIKFIDAANLSEIVTLAEAKDTKGARIVYDIVNNTADTMKIRKVVFLGDLSVREDESLELWRVSFKLREVSSVSEAVGARQELQPATDQTPTGVTTEQTDSATPAAEDLTSFEKVLKWADDLIGEADKV